MSPMRAGWFAVFFYDDYFVSVVIVPVVVVYGVVHDGVGDQPAT